MTPSPQPLSLVQGEGISMDNLVENLPLAAGSAIVLDRGSGPPIIIFVDVTWERADTRVRPYAWPVNNLIM
jgi:hypothetical protein